MTLCIIIYIERDTIIAWLAKFTAPRVVIEAESCEVIG